MSASADSAGTERLTSRIGTDCALMHLSQHTSNTGDSPSGEHSVEAELRLSRELNFPKDNNRWQEEAEVHCDVDDAQHEED